MRPKVNLEIFRTNIFLFVSSNEETKPIKIKHLQKMQIWIVNGKAWGGGMR